MKILKEEIITDWRKNSFEYQFQYGNFPFFIFHTILWKLSTNLTPVSNYCMFGQRTENLSTTLDLIFSPIKAQISEAITKMYKTTDPESHNKYRAAIVRSIPNVNGSDFTLYYDFIVNITAPFVYKTRLTKKNYAELVAQIESNNNSNHKDILPTLKQLTPEQAQYPWIGLIAFTGGFKKEPFVLPNDPNKPHARTDVTNIGVFDITNDKKLPEITSKDFQDLVNYQNKAKGGYKK